MATKKPVVVLFEDDTNFLAEFRPKVKRQLGTRFELDVFKLGEPPSDLREPFERRLTAELAKRKDIDRVCLLVTDRDLSQQSQWRGLSESAVSVAARSLGIPVAAYQTKKLNEEDNIERKPGNGVIDLSDDVDERADEISTIARGFVELAARVNAHNKALKAKKAKAAPSDSPGSLLADILGKPIVGTRLDSYACGDQRAIEEILRHWDKDLTDRIKARLIVALGVWLVDQVMCYPGVLVKEKAAASYLDIDPKGFARPEVRKIFESALYRNLPFASKTRPMWWRHELDDIVNNAGCSTGLEVCQKRGIKRLRYCPCNANPALHAGYFCMATGEPISEENSSGRVRWFPQGADLARVRKRSHDMLGPWLGT